MAWVVAAVPAVMGIFGAQDQKKAAKVAGIRAQNQKNYEAALLEQQAGQQQAAAQQQGFEERRKTQLMASRALALSAAGGGGANDPSVVNIIGDIAGEGAYREAVALYQGESAARKLKEGASITRMEGVSGIRASEAQGRAYDYQALGYAAKGGSSLYSKYGGSQPTTTQPSNDLSSGVGVYV